MRWLAIIGLCLALGGCLTQAEREQQAKADDAKCLSYGAKYGEPAYVQCRSQLDAARTQAEATENAAPVPMPGPVRTVPMWHPGQF